MLLLDYFTPNKKTSRSPIVGEQNVSLFYSKR